MPGDPVVGSTILRRPAIQSPDYVAGTSGWTVNQDGSAEFNNLTIRGTFAGLDFVIDSSGAFFYSGTPAAGNLIISVANAAGSDAYANGYPEGIQVGPSSGAQVAMIPGAGAGAAELQFPLPSPALSNVPNVAGGTTGTLAELAVSGPALAAAGENDWVQVLLWSNDGIGDTAHLDFVYVNPAGTALVMATYTASGWAFNAGVTMTSLSVTSLTVNGSSDTGIPTVNSTSTNGLANGTINGTSGAASAGTAHTHGGGSYAVTSGQHSHDLQNHEHPL